MKNENRMDFHHCDAGAFNNKELRMTKEEALKIIKLLSALESWSFSTKERLPDYLHDDLCVHIGVLEKIVLEKPE